MIQCIKRSVRQFLIDRKKKETTASTSTRPLLNTVYIFHALKDIHMGFPFGGMVYIYSVLCNGPLVSSHPIFLPFDHHRWSRGALGLGCPLVSPWTGGFFMVFQAPMGQLSLFDPQATRQTKDATNGTSASLLGARALLVVTRSYWKQGGRCHGTSSLPIPIHPRPRGGWEDHQSVSHRHAPNRATGGVSIHHRKRAGALVHGKHGLGCGRA